jgi:hypothetical protein
MASCCFKNFRLPTCPHQSTAGGMTAMISPAVRLNEFLINVVNLYKPDVMKIPDIMPVSYQMLAALKKTAV